MNYYELQIENFEQSNVGVPSYLVILALVERFSEGWDAGEIEKLTPSEIKQTEDWSDLKKSIAWPYCSDSELLTWSILNPATRTL